MPNKPDFIIIGAMKSATSSLYQQLSIQDGIFMCSPKEPNFFSDNENYRNGSRWYEQLFNNSGSEDICGEASTHYTKLPTYPHTVERMRGHLKNVKLVYLLRNPIDRLISHYIHEWSQRVIKCDIDKAITDHPELIEYGYYDRQIEPYLSAYGRNSILLVSFDRLKHHPQSELERICRFIGYKKNPKWVADLAPSNISRERIRRFPLYDVLIESPFARTIRRTLVPKSWRTRIKRRLTMQQRPQPSNDSLQNLETLFNRDLHLLGQKLGLPDLNCSNFSRLTSEAPLEWARQDD